MNKISKGDLNFIMNEEGEFFCQELSELPQKFNSAYADNEDFKADFEKYLELVRDMFELHCGSKEEYEAMNPEDRRAQGRVVISEIMNRVLISIADLSLFDQMMLLLSHSWWYFHPEVRSKITWIGDREEVADNHAIRMIQKYILPILPEQIRSMIENLEARNTSINNGHFAILFVDSPNRIRRIVTDSQLFEIHQAAGYAYLDITSTGKPIARFCCPEGGERAFFDGTRLMKHDQFQTCAPKTVLFGDGYKVNSTRCTIINGRLYPLIDQGDKVAQTTGAWLGMCDFTTDQSIEAMKLAVESGKQLVINDKGWITLNDQLIKPVGEFTPCPKELLDSGFTLCLNSNFVEFSNIQYQKVMIVDDLQDWIEKISEKLGEPDDGGPEILVPLLTQDKRSALEAILETNPEALILDVHLTPDEEFDGLWIANQLYQHGFTGLVLLASGYPEGHLKAMKVLVNSQNNILHAPGKNPDKIKEILCKR